MANRTVSIIDRIGSLIPGYTGFKNRDELRRSDKKLREYTAEQLDEVEKFITKINIPKNRIEIELSILELEELRKACSTISSKIRYAQYGASAFFDNVQINEDELNLISQYDEKIFDVVNQLNLLIDQDYNPVFLISTIRSKLKEIESIYNKRNYYIQFNAEL
jgi:malonyl CoA-acyl carrier protein transacylase